MRGAVALAGLGLVLAGCATGPTRYPVMGERFHSDPIAGRGTVEVVPAPGVPAADAPAFVAAVQQQLARVGFPPAAPGAPAQYRATVEVSRISRPLPPRSSGLSIGLGGGGYSGGYRGGGVGLGGGVSFPIGGRHAREGVATQLAVRLIRGPDAIWEGRVNTIADATSPDAASDAVAARLAGALFQGFPGESGRSIEVK